MSIFSFNGRADGWGLLMSGLSFFAVAVFWAIVHGVAEAIVGDAGENGPAKMVSGIGFVLTLPIALWIYLAGLARRLHDIGASAWWLLLCVPVLPIASLFLLLAPGQKEENRFGA